MYLCGNTEIKLLLLLLYMNEQQSTEVENFGKNKKVMQLFVWSNYRLMDELCINTIILSYCIVEPR